MLIARHKVEGPLFKEDFFVRGRKGRLVDYMDAVDGMDYVDAVMVFFGGVV